MNRNSLLEMSGRAMHQMVRFTLNKGVDIPMMQELNFDGMNSEGRNKVERVQNYGFSSAPLPRDEQGAGTQSGNGGGGVGGDGEQPKGPAAEGICMFMGGQRNHPVCIAIDDRRHRPMGLKPGENAQYDDIGQMTLLRRAFTAILSLDSKDEKTGKMIERFVSLRHVEKEKQKRPKIGADKGGRAVRSLITAEQRAAQEAATAKEREDYKHEGESVNTEVRCTKGRIEFRAGDEVVGYYEKSSQTWFFKGKIAQMEFDNMNNKVEKVYQIYGPETLAVRLGLDAKDEIVPKVVTVAGPAKKTFAKPE